MLKKDECLGYECPCCGLTTDPVELLIYWEQTDPPAGFPRCPLCEVALRRIHMSSASARAKIARANREDALRLHIWREERRKKMKTAAFTLSPALGEVSE